MMSDCDVVTFPLVSWVKCGSWLCPVLTFALFLTLYMSISNDIFSTCQCPTLDGDVPRSKSYGVYISPLIRFARPSNHVADFNIHYKLLTWKFLKLGYQYRKLRKTFSKFYRSYFELISKFQIGLKSLLCQGLSEPEFYGDLVYGLMKIVCSNIFSAVH